MCHERTDCAAMAHEADFCRNRVHFREVELRPYDLGDRRQS
jgi:hypothetical protein